MQGWECPKCGRVYAPWVSECSACVATPAPQPPVIPGPIRPTFPPLRHGDFPEFEPRITCGFGLRVVSDPRVPEDAVIVWEPRRDSQEG